MIEPSFFNTSLLHWFYKNGRKNLPWQHPRTPYRVWISEVMLQQTQVNTVIPYFERFMQAFPTVSQLANAKEDTVLHLWSGLGYYARARHLYQAAYQISKNFKGKIPCDSKILQKLPGIGRSTAGAILSLGFNQPAPILDANVKRILSRLHAVAGSPNSATVVKKLWHLAESYMPLQNSADYTQSLMDFGSLVCTRKNPQCHHCPIQSNCIAFLNNQVHNYPYTKHSQSLPTRHTRFVVLINKHQKILLEKRPPVGIWGGLWSIPECQVDTAIEAWCKKHYHCRVKSRYTYPIRYHLFSHFRLAMHPTVCYVDTMCGTVEENPTQDWFTHTQWHTKGVAAPIKKLLTYAFNQIQANAKQDNV